MDKKIHRPDPDSVKAVLEVFNKHYQKRSTFYTMGYGILKGTHRARELAFQERLSRTRESIGKHFIIIDIRKSECGSRNGPFFFQGASGMGALIRGIWGTASYNTASLLCNTFGITQAGLRKYARNIRNSQGGNWQFDWLLREIMLDNDAIVLLCGCREAFKKNGKSWNCHRVPLSLELLEDLGEGWEVEHL